MTRKPDEEHEPARGLEDFVEKFILEEDVISESAHKHLDRIFLWLRNISVLIALLLFLSSLLPVTFPHLHRGVAYMFGAGAYFFEILLVTDAFRKKLPAAEMFMAYCFGPLYILLGLSYLFGH